MKASISTLLLAIAVLLAPPAEAANRQSFLGGTVWQGTWQGQGEEEGEARLRLEFIVCNCEGFPANLTIRSEAGSVRLTARGDYVLEPVREALADGRAVDLPPRGGLVLRLSAEGDRRFLLRKDGDVLEGEGRGPDGAGTVKLKRIR